MYLVPVPLSKALDCLLGCPISLLNCVWLKWIELNPWKDFSLTLPIFTGRYVMLSKSWRVNHLPNNRSIDESQLSLTVKKHCWEKPNDEYWLLLCGSLGICITYTLILIIWYPEKQEVSLKVNLVSLNVIQLF